jgi:hypothetical protein
MTNTPGDQPPPEPGRDPNSSQPDYWGQQGQNPPPSGPYGQVPYPQQPQQPGYPAPGQIQYAPDHPRATTSLVLGILGIVLCAVIAPFAWSMGRRTLNEIDASNGTVGGRGAAQAGYILGIVGTVLLVLGLIALVIYLVVMIAVVGGGVATSDY